MESLKPSNWCNMIITQCQQADSNTINSSNYSYHQYGYAQPWHFSNCHNCELQMVLYSTLLLHTSPTWHNKLTNVLGSPCKNPRIIIFISHDLSWSHIFKFLGMTKVFLRSKPDFCRICKISTICFRR